MSEESRAYRKEHRCAYAKCGKAFVAYSPVFRFCSPDCRYLGRLAERTPKRPAVRTITCPCGATFMVDHALGPDPVYCRPCAHQRHRDHRKTAKMRAKGLPVRPLLVSGPRREPKERAMPPAQKTIAEFRTALTTRLPDRIVLVSSTLTRVVWTENESEDFEMSYADANRALAAKASEDSGAIDEGL